LNGFTRILILFSVLVYLRKSAFIRFDPRPIAFDYFLYGSGFAGLGDTLWNKKNN